jgi:hypothetical protein
MFSGVSFVVPLALAGLVVLPALWWLLRLTPPRPQVIIFPPLKIMSDLMRKAPTAAHTPWWLLLLRGLAAVCAILALAGPYWQDADTKLPRKPRTCGHLAGKWGCGWAGVGFAGEGGTRSLDASANFGKTGCVACV